MCVLLLAGWAPDAHHRNEANFCGASGVSHVSGVTHNTSRTVFAVATASGTEAHNGPSCVMVLRRGASMGALRPVLLLAQLVLLLVGVLVAEAPGGVLAQSKPHEALPTPPPPTPGCEAC